MKKTLAFAFFAFMLFFSFVSAEEFNYTTNSDATGLSVVKLRYEPYPVNPGEYFDLYIQAQHGTGSAQSAKFELVPKFPFSLDSNENPKREFGKIYSEPVVLHYKVRVSSDAVEGTNTIELKYTSGESGAAWVVKTFDIEVAEAQTDFDLVVQDSTGTETSIAIANTGKNAANSLIVRVPEQDDFKASGADGQMVGNLDSGDYSIVSFGLTQTGKGDGYLTIEMDYTDNIGERRTVVKDVRYNFGSSVQTNLFNATNMDSSRRGIQNTQSTSVFSSVWFWVIVVIVVVAGFIVYKKYPDKFGRARKDKNKEEKKSKELPAWVASERKSTR